MKNKEYYLSIKYPIIIKEFWDDDENSFIYSAEIIELPGLKVYGDSYSEVMEEILIAKETWIEFNLKLGRQIPEPVIEYDVSGRITLRMPKSLHSELKRLTQVEGVGLNPLINELINKGMQNSLSQKVIDSVASLEKENKELKQNNRDLIRKLNSIEFNQKKANYGIPEEDNHWKKQKNFSSKGLFSVI